MQSESPYHLMKTLRNKLHSVYVTCNLQAYKVHTSPGPRHMPNDHRDQAPKVTLVSLNACVHVESFKISNQWNINHLIKNQRNQTRPVQISRETTGWPKSCDTKVQGYSSEICSPFRYILGKHDATVNHSRIQ